MAQYIICGYIGAKNMGDEFILKSIIRMVRNKDADAGITVASMDPSYTGRTIKETVSTIEWYGIGLTFRAFKNLFSLIKTIRETDYVVIGGGGLLQDVHSISTIPRYLIAAVIAKLFKRKVVYAFIGAGPITDKRLIKLVKDVSNHFTDYITVRDEGSKQLLHSIGVTTKIDVTSDPVFSMAEFLPFARNHEDSERIGICFRQFKVTNDIEIELKKVIETLVSQNKKILLFPLDLAEDQDLCYRLSDGFEGQVTIIDQYVDLDDLIEPLSQLDFMISMRLHGVITCASYGVPSLAVSYDPKVANMQRKIGMGDYLINIEDFNYERCMDKLKQLMADAQSMETPDKHVLNEQMKLEDGLSHSLAVADKHTKNVSKVKSVWYAVKILWIVWPERLKRRVKTFFLHSGRADAQND